MHFYISFADNADSECHRYCQKAIEYGPKNPEAYQVMASYLISKDRKKVYLRVLYMYTYTVFAFS